MRTTVVFAVGLLAPTIAHADSSFWEFSAALRLQPATQVVEASCDVDVELRGAIASVMFRQRIVNPGPQALGVVSELELPAGARIVGVTAQSDRGKRGVAVSVASDHPVEQAASDDVLGADPLVAETIGTMANGNERYRVIVEPLAADHEITVELRWSAVATIRNGSVHLVVPGRGGATKLAPCKGQVKATPGPGTSIAAIRIGGFATRSFVLDTTDVAIDAELAFVRPAPVVWTQTEPLGDGWSAQAVTVVAPPANALLSIKRRALLVIDGSRSMSLVNRPTVAKLVRAIGAALPQGSEIEGIVFDRTASRVLGAWQPANPDSLSAIEAAVLDHHAVNGSDPDAALELANRVIGADPRTQTMVVLITDGGFGNPRALSLVNSLSPRPLEIDLHAIVLDPGKLRSPGEQVLRSAINFYGGTYVEVSSWQLDEALTDIDSWLRPSLLELALHGARAQIPDQLRVGTGATVMSVVRAEGLVTLIGRADQPFKITASSGPSARIAELALAAVRGDALSERQGDITNDAHAATTYRKLAARHPTIDMLHGFAVLSTTGKISRARRDMIVGGGPYTRMVTVRDPQFSRELIVTPSAVTSSPIERLTLERVFRDQLQPRAFTCYQRALGNTPTLAGQVTFELELGRGEVIRAAVTGLGDDAFDACLVDAAYALEIELPDAADFDDDRTIARYPLAFSVRDQNPLIVLGDADSASPLDIDAIKGGVPRAPKASERGPAGPVHVETSTPLGQLRPH